MEGEVDVGDIVQLDPERTAHFAGCLMVVTALKTWGVQGYVQALGENGEPGGRSYYRAVHGTFQPTGGKAIWYKGE
jgi:hypothetical protein